MNLSQSQPENEVAIHLDAVGICYRLWENGQPTLASFLSQRARPREFWALQEISCAIRRGETVGLIGHNGAGKSTLLRVLARILPPQRGRVIVRGQVSPLLELNAGMESDLTGRENILLKGAMLGRTRAETRARMERIIEFAELREFIDQPLRTYSSGMMARLGFAIATDIEPDILLIDEVMSVGDAEFSIRSRKRMDELRADGATVVIASHNSAALRGMCDRVLWLAHGRVQMFGAAANVLSAYERASNESLEPDAGDDVAPNVYTLASDDTLYLLEFPHATLAEFQSAVQAPFDAAHISPARKLSDIPNAPRQFLARYRFVRGEFFVDQMTRLLNRAPVTATLLREPIARALHDVENSARANVYTRWLGARVSADTKTFGDELYLTSPLTRNELTRARDVLAQLAFVGIYEKSRETLLLFWHTFGWEPMLPLNDAPSSAFDETHDDWLTRVEALLRDVVAYPMQTGNENELKRANEFDIALYAYARELFDERFNEMLRVLNCRSADPFEIQRALREKFLQRAAQNGHARPMRWRMDRMLAGRGWYNVEYNPEYGAYRWMGPEPRAFVQLPLPQDLRDAPLRLSCNLIFPELSLTLARLALFVNDEGLTFTQNAAPDGSVNLDARIPRSRVHGRAFLQIAFHVGETFLPKQGAFRDSRKLGVAVRWIELEPLK